MDVSIIEAPSIEAPREVSPEVVPRAHRAPGPAPADDPAPEQHPPPDPPLPQEEPVPDHNPSVVRITARP